MRIKSTALCLLLASGLSVSAQWSTNWPAVSNSWWNWGPLLEEVCDAVDERARAVGSTFPLATNDIYWVRRGHLSAIAGKIEDICNDGASKGGGSGGVYVNIAASRGTNTDYDVWFDSNGDIDIWVYTNLVKDGSATTSRYWAAEDSGGWDLFTFNYPETLDEFKAALDKLTEVADRAYDTGGGYARTYWEYGGTNGWISGSWVWDGDEAAATWAEAKTDAEAEWGSGAFGNPFPAMFSTGSDNWSSGGPYRATITQIARPFRADGPGSGTNGWARYHSRVDMYLLAVPEAVDGTATWDDNGTGLRNGKHTLIVSHGPTNLDSVLMQPLTTNTIPNWVSEPSGLGVSEFDSLGFEVYGAAEDGEESNIIFVVDFAVSNGFQYVP